MSDLELIADTTQLPLQRAYYKFYIPTIDLRVVSGHGDLRSNYLLKCAVSIDVRIDSGNAICN